MPLTPWNKTKERGLKEALQPMFYFLWNKSDVKTLNAHESWHVFAGYWRPRIDVHSHRRDIWKVSKVKSVEFGQIRSLPRPCGCRCAWSVSLALWTVCCTAGRRSAWWSSRALGWAKATGGEVDKDENSTETAWRWNGRMRPRSEEDWRTDSERGEGVDLDRCWLGWVKDRGWDRDRVVLY